jgi:NAD(P)-dependent dehydrogenase (short-subunit alcohol dehydrogenase family)
MIDPGIKGRVAIVTGANQGIGAAAARALADQGVAVFLTYLRLGSDDPGVQATGLASYAIARAQTGESASRRRSREPAVGRPPEQRIWRTHRLFRNCSIEPRPRWGRSRS